MVDSARERMNIGRKVLAEAPKLIERVDTFHAWMIAAAQEVQAKLITPVVEGGRVAALQTQVGRFEVAEEIVRVEAELMVRIVFFRAPTALRRDPQEVYAVRVLSDGTAHFGAGPDPDHFDLGDWQDSWLPRNMIRLAYELAAGCTIPRS